MLTLLILVSAGYLHGQTLIEPSQFLESISSNAKQIQTISGDIIYTIEGVGNQPVIQKGTFNADIPKGYSKLEFTTPAYMSVLIKADKKYIKSSPQSQWKELPASAGSTGQDFSGDIFSLSFLNQFEYTAVEKEEGKDLVRFTGTQDGLKKIEVVYNCVLHLVEGYTLAGNDSMPSSRIEYKYGTISDIDKKSIICPVEIITHVTAGIMAVKGRMEL